MEKEDEDLCYHLGESPGHSVKGKKQTTEQYKPCDPIYMNTQSKTTNSYVYINVFKWWAGKMWLEQHHPETVVTCGEEPESGVQGGK